MTDCYCVLHHWWNSLCSIYFFLLSMRNRSFIECPGNYSVIFVSLLLRFVVFRFVVSMWNLNLVDLRLCRILFSLLPTGQTLFEVPVTKRNSPGTSYPLHSGTRDVRPHSSVKKKFSKIVTSSPSCLCMHEDGVGREEDWGNRSWVSLFTYRGKEWYV